MCATVAAVALQPPIAGSPEQIVRLSVCLSVRVTFLTIKLNESVCLLVCEENELPNERPLSLGGAR